MFVQFQKHFARAREQIWFPIALGSATIIFTVAVLVIWNVIFTRYYLLALSAHEGGLSANDIPDLGVGYWLLLAGGCLALIGVIAVVTIGVISNVRQRLYMGLQKTFIDSVTHELKSPLASIRLGLETMEMREMPPATRMKFVKMMQDDVDRLQAFIEHILEAGRLEHGEHSVELQQTSVRQVLDRCLVPVKRRYLVQDDVFAIDIALDDAQIITDPVALEIVLTNLIDNAVKYSNPDDLSVSIRIMEQGDNLVVEVRDSGQGLQRKHLKKIFKRFYRVQGRSRSAVRGTGLGLYVVRSIVKRMGGQITVDSEGLGKGSTFQVSLPFQGNAPELHQPG